MRRALWDDLNRDSKDRTDVTYNGSQVMKAKGSKVSRIGCDLRAHLDPLRV